MHPREYKTLEKREEELDKKSKPAQSSKPLQPTLDHFYKSDKITVSMTAEQFKEGLVELVAKEGVPLSKFDTSASKKLLGEMAAKVGVSLDRDRVKDYVLEAAEKLKTSIKSEIAGKFVHIKFDCATRIRTNYLGINIRYINSKNEAVTQTLAVKDTHSQHTSNELRVR